MLALFWADQRPNSDYYGHAITFNPALNKTTFSINQVNSTTWAVKLGSYTGYSTGNTMYEAEDILYGSETTADSGHSYSTGYSPSYYDDNNKLTAGGDNWQIEVDANQTFKWQFPSLVGKNYFAGQKC